ncbi:MAG: glycosyltransferase [Candidatus Woesearchaeota archaeon]
MRKVIFFTNGITGVGGAERVLLEASLFFKNKGIDVTIVAFVLDKYALDDYHHEIHKKIKFIDLDEMDYIKRIFRLRKIISKLDPDLIIGQSSLDCMYIYLSTYLTRYRYISYVHGSLFWLENDFLKYSLVHKSVFDKIRKSVIGHMQFVPKNIKLSLFKNIFFNIVALLEYFGVNKAKAIVVLTKQIQWEVKKLYNKRSVIIRGCVDQRLFRYNPKIDIKKRHNLKGKKIILNIGRLDPRKRIDILIKAFFNLCSERKNKYKDIVLMIGGRGSDQERLDKIIDNPKYSQYKDRVIMLGFVKDSEYFDYLAGCDIFAFPSWTTSGIPTYEALALGKKVVWTTEAEEPVLNHPNVYLADPNVAAFTEAIDKALRSKLYPRPDLSNNTWDMYFEKLYILANNVFSNRNLYKPK